jgi:hypothetical protein
MKNLDVDIEGLMFKRVQVHSAKGGQRRKGTLELGPAVRFFHMVLELPVVQCGSALSEHTRSFY